MLAPLTNKEKLCVIKTLTDFGYNLETIEPMNDVELLMSLCFVSDGKVSGKEIIFLGERVLPKSGYKYKNNLDGLNYEVNRLAFCRFRDDDFGVVVLHKAVGSIVDIVIPLNTFLAYYTDSEGVNRPIFELLPEESFGDDNKE